MELASRGFSKRYVNGLAKFVERDSAMRYAERRQWQRVKEEERKLFDPTLGGDYAVFDQRSLAFDV